MEPPARMRIPAGTRIAGLLVLGLLLARPAAPAEILPEMSARVRAAHYQPTEPDQRWTTWIGAGAGLVRAGGVTFYGNADVETILGNVRRAFDATQANYHLELGLRANVGSFELGPVFHHVSRHLVDRPKQQAVDWNLLGLRLTGSLHPSRPVRLLASLARTTEAALVGYRWELQAGADAELTGGPVRAYATAQARRMTVPSSAALPRGDFLDFRFEAGARWANEARVLEGFVALERRNDVPLEEPGVKDRALLGFRIRYASPWLFPLP
jgi:hypothetical protein